MFFDFGRQEGFPTLYAANKTPVTVDVLEAGLIFGFVILAACFYIVLLGYRGKRLYSVFTRVTVSLILGGIIIIGNFGQEWEVGHIKTPTAYKIGTGLEIDAEIGVKIGFRSVNVTLKADTSAEKYKKTPLEGEHIDYNERFEWSWDQGRFGFGPYAGLLQQEFRAAQYRGLPLPILWVVDYFVFDGEGLRWGRFYRTAGWYAHIALWTAFPCWILTNILFHSVIRYGVNFLCFTGLLQLTSCLIWGVVRNHRELAIPFEEGILSTKFGSSFYLTLAGGIICCVLSLVIFVLNMIWPDETAVFFGIDPLSDFDELHIAPNEISLREKAGLPSDGMQMAEMGYPAEGGEDPERPQQDDIVVLKRRTTIRFGRNSRKTFRNVNVPYDDDQPVYTNLQTLNTVSEDAPLHPTTSGGRRPPVLPPKRRK